MKPEAVTQAASDYCYKICKTAQTAAKISRPIDSTAVTI